MVEKDRVGVFGGTFNPVHIAHLALAQAACETLDLKQVIFVPAGEPPHKRSQADLAPAEHRYRMVQLAVADNPRFTVSRFEIDFKGPCYTIQTLEALERDLGPDTELVLLVGGDWAGQVRHWFQGEKILSRYSVASAGRRNGNSQADSCAIIDMPIMDISSSMIREYIRTKRSIRYLVPQSVFEYIHAHGLYGAAQQTLS
jgi:nicotinate-nucleotide adenylyltransferase